MTMRRKKSATRTLIIVVFAILIFLSILQYPIYYDILSYIH